MSRRCTICDHPKRHDIEQSRLSGASKRRIAILFDVSPDAVQRHTAHIAPPTKDNAPSGAIESPEDTAPRHEDNQRPEYVQHAVPGRAYYDHVMSYSEYEVSVSPETPVDVLKQGLPYIRRAVRLAGDNRLEQERLVAILNDALQSESMGLD